MHKLSTKWYKGHLFLIILILQTPRFELSLWNIDSHLWNSFWQWERYLLYEQGWGRSLTWNVTRTATCREATLMARRGGFISSSIAYPVRFYCGMTWNMMSAKKVRTFDKLDVIFGVLKGLEDMSFSLIYLLNRIVSNVKLKKTVIYMNFLYVMLHYLVRCHFILNVCYFSLCSH